MFGWYDKNVVNTGRQREFDYMKGIFMLLIFLIHAFQATGTHGDDVYKVIYIISTMTGAVIFIFVMGFGSVYSRSATPSGFVKSGIRLVIYQYLNNLAYVAAMLLPFVFVAGALAEESRKGVMAACLNYLQYINIFFISGIIYLVLALLKKLNAHTLVYVILGVAISLAAPFVYGTEVDVPVLGYIVKLFIGEGRHVSFTVLYFLPYALFGVAFAKMFRHVNDKRRFYLTVTPLCAVIVAVWWVTAIMRNGSDIASMYSAMSYGYTHPDLWRAVASMAHLLLFAAVVFFINDKSGVKDGLPKNPVSKQLLYYNTHISKYYALHMLTYNAALGFHMYKPFESWQCWVLMLICMVITEIMVRGYNKVYDTVKKKKAEAAQR